MKKYVFTSILLFLFSIVAGFLLGTNLWFIKDHIPKAEAAIVVSLLNICFTLLALVAMLVRMYHGNQKIDPVSAGKHRSSVQDQILEKRMRLYQELIMKIKKYQKYYFDLLSTPNYSEEKFNEKKSFQKYDELHKWLKQFHDQNKLFLSKDMSDLIYYYLIAANLDPEDDHHLYSAHAVYHQIVQFTAHPRTVKKIHKAHPSWSPDYIKNIGQDPLTFGHLIKELPEKWIQKRFKSDLGQKQNRIALSILHFIGHLTESDGYKLQSDLAYFKRLNQLSFHLTQLISNELNLESLEEEINIFSKTNPMVPS
ncbi:MULTISPECIES: hypothetical protein [unclassified Thermoactinomyces]|uniref:hypothetical protein n=1 Tax=unclassified Thermoactinomyces TaxID=2634588 RepID=UPI00079FD985|nr:MULTISPECIES: hypothetical protein [unclassified Thermoactinomyces]KYQ86765.1 hypothetical protein AYX07_06365 [Thermoactinomyces sp. AS95]MBI0386684.1 hypothetical protein [Thermoactinomyces sp. CICC 24227]MBI0391458.1 hypothetical protein [Thermoactinomyces sp. CICC 24226]